MDNNSSMSDKETSTSDTINKNSENINASFKSKPAKKNNFPWVLACLSILAVMGVGAWAFQLNSNLSKANSELLVLNNNKQKIAQEIKDIKESTGEASIDKSGFQAVFLKSEKAYFGKITKITDSQITLTNIYYLRSSNSGKLDLENLPQDASLAKLGCEIHGPKDEMFIERKEVEFWENLKKEGEVFKAIDEYQKANPDGQKCETSN